MATIIKQENERLNQHVEKVLSIAKLDDSHFKLNLEDVDLNEKIRAIVANKELELEQSGARVNLDLTNSSLRVKADQLHLSNVIYNLLDNAVKYKSDDPVITISTQVEADRVVMRIKDNGIGIAEEHHRDLFKKFFRVPTGNLHNVKGFGLENKVHRVFGRSAGSSHPRRSGAKFHRSNRGCATRSSHTRRDRSPCERSRATPIRDRALPSHA